MSRKAQGVFAALIALTIMSACSTARERALGEIGSCAPSGESATITAIHTLSECHRATLLAFDHLGLKIVSDETDRLSGVIKAEGREGEPVRVELTPQGLNITRVEVRVGPGKREGESQLVADTIRAYLDILPSPTLRFLPPAARVPRAC